MKLFSRGFKKKTSYHCKIGKSSNLEECLRQSIYGTKLYYQESEITKSKTNSSGKIIGKANASTGLYLKKGPELNEFLISEIKSLKTKMSFIDWYNTCIQMKIKAQLIVSNYIK